MTRTEAFERAKRELEDAKLEVASGKGYYQIKVDYCEVIIEVFEQNEKYKEFFRKSIKGRSTK